MTPWFAKREVPTEVNLNPYVGNGSFVAWHRDNQRLFGHPSEPKVIVSMSLGFSVLLKIASSQVGEYSLSNSDGSW